MWLVCYSQNILEMKITLNNRAEELDLNQPTISIEELLALKSFTYKMLFVKHNGVVVKKEDYPVINVAEGDNVEVIHLMTGG